MAVLSLVAAIGSAVGTFLAWGAGQSANEVSRASQALTLKVYNDQIALGHPSVSVLSGHTSVSEPQEGTYLSEDVKSYAATLNLRNSGQRDSPRAWVSLSPDALMADPSRTVMVTLPKEIDVRVRLPIETSSYLGRRTGSWLVAVIYQDEVPSPVLNNASNSSSLALLRMICSQPIVFRMTSWAEDEEKNPEIRVFSSGSPVTAKQVSVEWNGGEEAAKRVTALEDEVIHAAHSVNACSEVSDSSR